MYTSGLIDQYSLVFFNGYIDLVWPQNVTIAQIIFHNDLRPLNSLSIGYWNGSMFVVLKSGVLNASQNVVTIFHKIFTITTLIKYVIITLLTQPLFNFTHY